MMEVDSLQEADMLDLMIILIKNLCWRQTGEGVVAVEEGMERNKISRIKKVGGAKEIRKRSDMLKILSKTIDKTMEKDQLRLGEGLQLVQTILINLSLEMRRHDFQAQGESAMPLSPLDSREMMKLERREEEEEELGELNLEPQPHTDNPLLTNRIVVKKVILEEGKDLGVYHTDLALEILPREADDHRDRRPQPEMCTETQALLMRKIHQDAEPDRP